MEIQKLKDIIIKRLNAQSLPPKERTAAIKECLRDEMFLITSDISGTVEYLKSECSAQEFVQLGEIIEDLILNTKSDELLDAYKNLISKYPEEAEKNNIPAKIQEISQFYIDQKFYNEVAYG